MCTRRASCVHARTVHVQAQIMQCTCTAVGLHVQFLLLPKNSLLYTYSTVCKTMYHTVHNYTYCSPTVQRQTYSTIIKQLFIKSYYLSYEDRIHCTVRVLRKYVYFRTFVLYFLESTFVLSYEGKLLRCTTTFESTFVVVLSYFRTKVSYFRKQLYFRTFVLSKVLSYFRTFVLSYLIISTTYESTFVLPYFRAYHTSVVHSCIPSYASCALLYVYCNALYRYLLEDFQQPGRRVIPISS